MGLDGSGNSHSSQPRLQEPTELKTQFPHGTDVGSHQAALWVEKAIPHKAALPTLPYSALKKGFLLF